nr:hypothetical protein [Rhodococcus sp. 06-418-1B]
MNSEATHAALAAVEPLSRAELWAALKFLSYADPDAVLIAVGQAVQ